MSLQYIRDHYQVPAKRGSRITFHHGDPRTGTITGASDARIRVRFDGETHPVILHPTWQVTYEEDIER